MLRVSGQNVAVSTRGRFSVRLRCDGSVCRGVLALTATGSRTATRGRGRAPTIVMARRRFTLPRGATILAPGQLNATGRHLFAIAHGRRAANVIAALDGGPGYSRALSIRLVRASGHAPGPSHATPTATTTGPGAPAQTLPAPGVDGSGSGQIGTQPVASGVNSSGSGQSGTLPLAPSGPCVDVDLAPVSVAAGQTLSTTLCLINAQRTAAGLRALHENSLLDQAATAHTNDMIAKDYFAHVSPTGMGVLEMDHAHRVPELEQRLRHRREHRMGHV